MNDMITALLATCPDMNEQEAASAVRELWEPTKSWPRALGRELHLFRAAYAAGVKAATPQWQPIETAPSSGSFLVTYRFPGEPWPESIELVKAPFLPDGRIFNLNSGNYSVPRTWTHWMPIPGAEVVDGD